MKITVERQPWEIAVERAALEFKHGDLISREWLEKAFGIEWPDRMSRSEAQAIALRFFAQMEGFRDAMLHQHKMALLTNQRGAWLIVPPGQQHLVALETARRGIAKALAKADEIIEQTRVDLLSQQEAQERRAAAAKLNALALMSTRKLGAASSVAALEE